MHKALDNVLVNKMSPSKWESVWLYNFLKRRKVKMVLEFGCGVSTLVALNALKLQKTPPWYICVEDYQPNIDMVRAVYPSITILPTWASIQPDLRFDVVVVDGSSGSGLGVRGHRVEAIMFAEKLATRDAIFILHDAHSFSGKGAVQYVVGAGYTLLAWYEGKKGFAVYQRPMDDEDKMIKWKHVSAKAPKLCAACRFCHSKEELYSEIPVKGDIFNKQGFVMRVGCLCDPGDAYEKDDTRTAFLSYRDAVNAWNEQQKKKL